MDYLTLYYKNLSEQLQDKVNHLNNILSEVVITKVSPVYNRGNTSSKTERIDTEKGEKFIDNDENHELDTRHKNDVTSEIDRRETGVNRAISASKEAHFRLDTETGPETTAEERQRAQQQANMDESKKRSENQANVGPSAGRKT